MGSETCVEDAAVEPAPVQDTFISGAHRVEFLGRGNVRIYLYADEDDSRVIVGKIVMAVEDVPMLIASLVKATWHKLTHIPWMEVGLANRLGRN